MDVESGGARRLASGGENILGVIPRTDFLEKGLELG